MDPQYPDLPRRPQWSLLQAESRRTLVYNAPCAQVRGGPQSLRETAIMR